MKLLPYIDARLMLERLRVIHYWWCVLKMNLFVFYSGQKYERLIYMPGGVIDGWKLNVRDTLLIAQHGLVIKNCVFTYPKNFGFDRARMAVGTTNVTITGNLFKTVDDDMNALYDLREETKR